MIAINTPRNPETILAESFLHFMKQNLDTGGEAIDLFEDSYGYKLDSVLSSGMGSAVNPTRFFAVMSK